MTRKRILLIGGGGHCKSCIDVIASTQRYEIVGILDLPEKVGSLTLDVPVIGVDDDLPQWLDRVDEVLISVGQIRSSNKRVEILANIEQLHAPLATVISPLAYLGAGVKVQPGTIIMHGAKLIAGSSVGSNSIINSNALIEHDATVGSHCHVSTGAIVNGNAVVKDHTFVGSGAVIIQGVTIGDHSLVGAGEVIRRDVPAGYHPRQGAASRRLG